MYFDIAMPLTLFAVTVTAMFLSGKIEKKLKITFEEKELGIRDVVILIAMISLAVSIVVFIPQIAVMSVFLFVYSMLLFVFTYIFSSFQKKTAMVLCAFFAIASILIATISFFIFGSYGMVAYGALAFYCLCLFSLIALLYEKRRTNIKERWYLAVLPSAVFIILYIFYNQTPLWFPYLLNTYGAVFAVLVILYLGSLFTWRTTLVFSALLTGVDVFLVLVTRAMISAATHVSELRLPVLITLQTIPAIMTPSGFLCMSLGLGDFFFSGLIAVQTLKKFGKNFALLSAVAMATSFFIFETLILNFEVSAFPGTLMIICGWLPLLAFKFLREKITRQP